MRKLLILSRYELEKRIVHILRRNDWGLLYASDMSQARALAEQHQPLVGLALFPESAADALLKEYEQMRQQAEAQEKSFSCINWCCTMG